MFNSHIAVAHTKFTKGREAPQDASPLLEVLDLKTALETDWPTDAHFVQYIIPNGLDGTPRIRKAGLKRFTERGIEIQIHTLAFDYDNTGLDGKHAPWPDEAVKDAFYQKFAAVSAELEELANWRAYYTTRGGARVVYELKAPVAPDIAEEICLGILDAFASKGIKFDTTCKDWTRLFRLPHVMRDRVNTRPTTRLEYREEVDPANPERLPRKEIAVLPEPPPPATKNKKASTVTPEDMPAWLKKRILAKCDALAKMEPESGRNNAAYKLAAEIGNYVPKYLTRQAAEDFLLTAAMRCACPNAEDTIKRGLDDGMKTIASTETAAQGWMPVSRRMSEIEERPVNWLWKPFLAEGMTFLFAGPPGIGKTFVAIDAIARITQGLPFPFQTETRTPQSVLIWAEDPPEYVLRPRLRAAGADLGKVHVLDGKRIKNKDESERIEPLNLADLSVLEQAIQAAGDCALLVIDPVNAYFGGGTDTHKQSEVASLLTPFAVLATKYKLTVLFIHHFNKSSSGSGENRLGGSVAFRSAVRGVSYVTKDKNDDSLRWLAVSKSNIGIDKGGLSYRLVDSLVLGVPKIEWIESCPDMDGNTNACDTDSGGDSATNLDSALREAISSAEKHELDFSALKAVGGNLGGYGKSAVHTALVRIGATSHKVGFGKGSHSVWRLPIKPQRPVFETLERLESLESSDAHTGEGKEYEVQCVAEEVEALSEHT